MGCDLFGGKGLSVEGQWPEWDVYGSCRDFDAWKCLRCVRVRLKEDNSGGVDAVVGSARRKGGLVREIPRGHRSTYIGEGAG